MDKFIHGLWGCFFGMAVVVLIGSWVAYTRSLHRIAVNAGLTALLSAFFVTAFLGGLPIGNADTLARFLALFTALLAGFLNYQFLMTLSMLKEHGAKLWALSALAVLCLGVLMLGWVVSPRWALLVSSLLSVMLAVFALAISVRSARRGERLAWAAVVSVLCSLVALVGLTWIALNRDMPLPAVHAVTAIASTLYLALMACFIWKRYVCLIELHEVMAYGPGYDPVTRMRSHLETGQMVGSIFKNFRDKPAPMGVVVLTIANLGTLQQLHGIAAVNNAFFVCAERLRHWVPRQVKMGRLGEDGFLLIMQNCSDSKQVIDMARSVELQLRRSVKLSSSREATLAGVNSLAWVAEIGVGILMVANPLSRGSDAIAMGRRMARTAISYASRIAWFDISIGETVELPALQARA